MIRRDIINVVGDMENFLDSLLAHTEEENCQHSVPDFLQEYFDKKNGRISGLPNGRHERGTNDSNLQPTDKEGGD